MRRFLVLLMLLVPVVASSAQLVETLECTVAEATSGEEEEGACEDECSGCECCPVTPRLTLVMASGESEPSVRTVSSGRVELSPLRAAVPDEILHVPLA